jgi:hypothetical protein
VDYPEDEELEADRHEFLDALQAAARQNLAVVSFYH